MKYPAAIKVRDSFIGRLAAMEQLGAFDASQHTCPETLREVGIWERIPKLDWPRLIVRLLGQGILPRRTVHHIQTSILNRRCTKHHSSGARHFQIFRLLKHIQSPGTGDKNTALALAISLSRLRNQINALFQPKSLRRPADACFLYNFLQTLAGQASMCAW